MDLIWRLGTVGGNPAHPEGALEWPARAAERQRQIEEQLLRLRAAESGGDASPDPRTRDLERLAADVVAVRPALDALVAIARGAVAGANVSTLWPILRAFLDEWLLQPADGPRVHLILDEQLGNVAADATCGSLVGDDALRIFEDAILTERVHAGRFGEPAVYVGALREAVGLRFSAVRVIGLAEGHLPAVPREDPVIPDAARDALRKAGCGLVSTAADWVLESLHALDSVVRNAERRVAFSAPRLRHSRVSAPVPAKSSSTRAPATRAPRLLKTACRTKSGVGRTSYPFGTLSNRPPAVPPMMRMLGLCKSRVGNRRNR